jgi:acetyl-CoA carboxylase carboxyltransferase component
MLGSYDHEEEALSRVRDFWKIFRDVNLAPPPLWMPCADGDRAFAIEDLHLKMWSQQYPDVNALAVCKKYASELSRNRKKPCQIDVWNTLIDRLEQEQSSTMSADDNRVFDYTRG